MKKQTRENKFNCPLGGYVDGHNCHALGCLHLINNGCPIYRRMADAEGGMLLYKKWCPICRHNKNNVCDFENCFSNNVDSDYKTICRWFDDRVKLNCQLSFLGEL